MIQTTIWIPPSLCGCQLRITADWTSDSIKDGISYRHPIPFTIKAIEIVSVCPAHDGVSMPDTLGLFEVDKETDTLIQRRGYLKHPIANPTQAEILYTFLSQFNGQTHRLPCGCQSHQFIDENKEVRYLQHEKHTKKCHAHKHDTVDMEKAKDDHRTSIALEK